MTFEAVVKNQGFESETEFHRLVSQIDLTSLDKTRKFLKWQENNGSKKGLLDLLK